jgi:hypothetical protein
MAAVDYSGRSLRLSTLAVLLVATISRCPFRNAGIVVVAFRRTAQKELSRNNTQGQSLRGRQRAVVQPNVDQFSNHIRFCEFAGCKRELSQRFAGEATE